MSTDSDRQSRIGAPVYLHDVTGDGAARGRPSRSRAHARRRARPKTAPPRTGAGYRAWLAQLLAWLALSGPLAQPALSVRSVWRMHRHAASFYEDTSLEWLGWLRLAYGAAHAWVLVPALYALAWLTDSLPKALAVAAAGWLLLWLAPVRLAVLVVPGHFWITF